MDTSKKRHFVFTDLFASADSPNAQPIHKEMFKRVCYDKNSSGLLTEGNSRPRSKEISIGMLTNGVRQVPLPCIAHKLNSCNECEVRTPTHEIKFPLRDCANRSVIRMAENGVTLVPKTPPRSSKAPLEPLTPTSNLKLLTDLASRENVPQQEELENEFQEEDYENIPSDALKYTSRKDKSLGLLAAKFLSQYPEYPTAEFLTEISLDKASEDLNVGRRRIYDVVNVLEAVQIVKKCAKNVYAWLGKTNLKLTLASFKKQAELEKLGDQITSLTSLKSQNQSIGPLKDSSNSSIASSSGLLAAETPLPSENLAVEGNPFIRREKSLGMMSQKFMMLLLVSNPQVLSLDLAARFLIGESGSDDKNSTMYKTKMRRLYSITHVLTSLALIEKVDNLEIRGCRKPAYRFTGPNFDDISSTDLRDFESALMSLQSSPMLLMKRPVPENEFSLGSGHNKLPRTRSEGVIVNKKLKSDGKSLSRRLSLQDVCEVAEKERRRLLFPITQRALENRKIKPETTSPPNQGCATSTNIVSKNKPTAILLTSNGTPLRVISISSSADGSSMLRLAPSTTTSASENVTRAQSEAQQIPVVQLPLVLQFESESHS